MEWVSQRKQAELDRAERIALFDTFVDFVLDGEIEFATGLQAYRETLEDCGLNFPALPEPAQPSNVVDLNANVKDLFPADEAA